LANRRPVAARGRPAQRAVFIDVCNGTSLAFFGGVLQAGMELVVEIAVVMAALPPLLSLVAIPAFMAWRARRRAAIVRRQIELTDAIDRELGARGAPFVRKGFWGPWQIRIAVPFERLAIGRRVLGIVLRTLDRIPGRYEVVLTPRDEGSDGQSSPAGGRRTRGGHPPKGRISRDRPLAWRLPVGEAAATRSRPTHGRGEWHGASIG
jgi:hypothetical protein